MAIQIRYYISLIVIILDQLSKIIFKKYFSFTKNTGSLFGLFKGYNLFFIFLTIIIIIFIVYYLLKVKEKYKIIFFSLILGGAIGNLIDRLIYGYVIDFIDLRIWPSFNVADSAITIGIIGLIIYYWKR